jgi:hypothetical protein
LQGCPAAPITAWSMDRSFLQLVGRAGALVQSAALEIFFRPDGKIVMLIDAASAYSLAGAA